MAYGLLSVRKKVAEALDMFLYNVRSYPESANAHDSPAEGYEAAGRTKLALGSHRTACRLAEQFSDPQLPTFRTHGGSAKKHAGERWARSRASLLSVCDLP